MTEIYLTREEIENLIRNGDIFEAKAGIFKFLDATEENQDIILKIDEPTEIL